MGGETKFIDRMAAILNVDDTSRIKIVGIYTGSVVVTAVIDEETQSEDDSENNDNTAKAAEMEALNARLGSLYDDGTMDTEFQNDGFGVMTGFSSQVFVIPDDDGETTTPDDKKSNLALIIGVALGGAALLTMIIIGCLYCVRKRARIDQEVDDIDSEERSDKIGDKMGVGESNSFGAFHEK